MSNRSIDSTNAIAQLALIGDATALLGELAALGINTAEFTAEHSASDLASMLLTKLRERGPITQGVFAVACVNCSAGTIAPARLTEALKAAFPGAGVGDRHGPHYLSLARTGSLAGVRFAPGRAPRLRQQTSAPTEAAPAVTTIEATPAATPAPTGASITGVMDAAAVLAQVNGSRKELQALAKSMSVSAGGSNEEIAQRVAHALAQPAAPTAS